MNEKPFLDYVAQIVKLKNKELNIKNEEETISSLKSIGYYQLVSGYKAPFKNAAGYYRKGVEFHDIVRLYFFDEALRNLFLEYILKIEKTMCSHISYYFSKTYGSEQQQYLSPQSYNLRVKRKFKQKLIEELRYYAIRDSKHEYIVHYREQHHNVPMWVVINALSIGKISALYSCLKDEVKSQIALEFEEIDESDIEAMLKSLTKFRNICAHGERLYNERIGEAIPDTFWFELPYIAMESKR